jgi:hypothetical protein
MRTLPRWCWHDSRHLLASLIVALGVLATCLSSADEALRVVVLRGEEGSTTTSRRLEAELRSLGLVVISRAFSGPRDTHALLEQAARREGAIAAVRVIAQGTKAELWIADRVTNKTVLREISIESQDRNRADDSIAVGVAELLRASLMEVNAPSQRRGAYASTAALRELGYAPSERSSADDDVRFWLNLGVGAELGVRGVGPSMLGQARAGWTSERGFGLELFGGVTLIPALIERPTGRARLSSQWFGAAATFDWSHRNSNWSARTGMGVLGVHVRARGENAARPLTSVTETATSAGPYVYAGPAFGSNSFRLRLNAGALVLLTPPTVRFAEETVARWGAPSLFLDLGVEGVISR